MKISKKLFLLSVIPLSIALLGAGISFVSLYKTKDSIERYLSTVDVKYDLVIKIYDELGYGKGIHAFKNYVLRKDQKYKDHAYDGLTKADRLISKYMVLDTITVEEIVSLVTVRDTVNEYIKNLNLAYRLILEDSDSAVIDNAVKIDDGPAVDALNSLKIQLYSEKTEAIEKLNSVFQNTVKNILTFFILSFIASIIASKTISNRISGAIEKLMNYSHEISKGIWKEKKIKPIDVSKDEIQNLADQIYEMNCDLNELFKKMKTSNDDLRQLSMASAHDLKTPLKNILGCSELFDSLIMANDLESIQVFSTQIKDETERMINYVNDLLSFTRIEAESLEVEEFDPNDLIDTIEKQIAASKKTVELYTNFDSQMLCADKTKIAKILSILCENSLEHSKESVRIEITGEPTTDGLWEFSVLDNGDGIESKDFEKIFLPFRKATTKQSGTGIGLALAKKMVDVHFGDIRVDSVPGQYTKITFTIMDLKAKQGEQTNANYQIAA